MNGASAGRVLLIFKGDYESATTYKPLDVVIYGVNSYVCLLQSTGNVPTNTTYWQILAKGISNMSPEAIGIGYGLSQNSGASKTATLADYTLTINGIVAVTFAEDVPANATLNINSQGAKPIYFRGSAIVANVIKGGDTVTFAYDGTHYDILCIDGGAGHKILKADGTELPQRDALQASDGLEFVDDSTNQRTKIKMNLPTISLSDWNAMSTQEQEAYKASHYRFGVELPDTSGVINAEYMKLGWENPNTTQTFAGQTVSLSSADYDFLMTIFAYANDSSAIASVVTCPKGNSIQASAGITTNSGARVYQRNATRNSDTSYTFGDCTLAQGTSAQSTNNAYLIPVAIYLIKSSFQFKMNAIADKLSTRADHCFLDDETTTVEDAITYKDVYSTDEHVVGKWIDGSILYEKTIENTGTGARAFSFSSSAINVKVIKEASISYSSYVVEPYYMASNDYWNYYLNYNDRNCYIRGAGTSMTNESTFRMTLRYTKTS